MTKFSDACQIWALALAIFTMYCKDILSRYATLKSPTKGFAASIYWDLGGNETQFGSPEAIGKLVVLQSKVFSLLHDDSSVIVKTSTGSSGWRSHLGSRCHFHSRLGPHSLHSHISDKIFPHDLLCGPRYQRSIRSLDHHRRIVNLPPNIIQLGPFKTGWLLWRSKIAGSVHRDFQSADGRDCGCAADARAMGFANGHAKETRINRHVWIRHCVCLFSVALFAPFFKQFALINI